jgi:hypothetical protein
MQAFRFMTSVEAVQLTGRRAASLMELYLGLKEVDGACLYHHTHRFYRAHSFLGHSDRSDFALWVGQNLREEAVAESLGSLDLRDYRTLESLRQALLAVLEPFMSDGERWIRRVPPGLEFHFCRSVSLVLDTGYVARDLEEFERALERVDVACLHHHLIEAPLHSQDTERRYPNDFSEWLADLGSDAQARAVAELDPYQGNLEIVRESVLRVLRGGRLNVLAQRVADRLPREPAGEAAADWLRRWRRGA